MECKILLHIHGRQWIVVNDVHPVKKSLSILTFLDVARIVIVSKDPSNIPNQIQLKIEENQLL